ncbi:MAG TPA: GMC family oxidoreductase N-terminal domain-containing protein [Blastocatellia bacterium]|nr:GMC family oxidoreductase N-terminal domain-containing protein [Blastocatellia bacterium]
MENMHTVTRTPLANSWDHRRADGYDVVVIGSGYGGAITAARLATANWPGAKPSVCVLERGKEWLPGQFPDNLEAGAGALRSDLDPLGLYDFHFGTDIAVVKGSGLGGTSLVNANVAYQPEDDLFDEDRWPQAIRNASDSGELGQYYARARSTLFAERHPHGNDLSKVKALKRGSDGKPGTEFDLLDIAVNFKFEGPNNWGVRQRKCINCGDCVTGCNVGAKNTLDTNYLALAKHGGAHIFTQVEVRRIEKLQAGGYLVHYTRRESAQGPRENGTLKAKRAVVVAAGSLGSTVLMLRSRLEGLSLPDTLGTRFSGNGDFFGLAYNSDVRSDVLGWGAHPTGDRARRLQPSAGETRFPGPSIVARLRYKKGGRPGKRITVEDLSFPLMYVDAARAAFSVLIGRDTDPDDFFDDLDEARRRLLDVGAFNPELEKGALNFTMLYLVMGRDDAGGRVELDSAGRSRIRWPDVGRQKVFTRQNNLLLEHAKALGATFIENPLWGFTPFRTLITAHPLGGCPLGEDQSSGLVNDRGQVFDRAGGTHDGLYISDGSIIPMAIGVNPLLTISALSERIADGLIGQMGGTPFIVDHIG